MNDFKRNRGFRGGEGGQKRFGNSKFGDRDRDRDRDRGDRGGRPMQLFPAVCAQCGRNCEVPFRPTGDKPVYCLDCFNRQPHVPGRNSNGADGPRQSFRREERPRFAEAPRPVANDAAMDALKRRLETLESKIDRVLELMDKKPEGPTLGTLVEEATKAKKAPAKTKTKPKEKAKKAKRA